MPRKCSFPTILDKTRTIHLSELKEWGYLKPNILKRGVIKWINGGVVANSISIMSNTLDEEHPYIELDYLYRGVSRNYKIQLVSVPSNLGKGKVWHFLCPQSLKLCRILYSSEGYYSHREAIDNGYYDEQLQPKEWREKLRILKKAREMRKLSDQIPIKGLRTHYAGKPTKRYLRIMKILYKPLV